MLAHAVSSIFVRRKTSTSVKNPLSRDGKFFTLVDTSKVISDESFYTGDGAEKQRFRKSGRNATIYFLFPSTL